MRSRVKKGVIAGLAATAAVSVLEIVNLAIGQPVESFPLVLADMLGMPGQVVIGFIAHFAAGALVLGPLFGILCPRLPTDTAETKGILFAVAAWVLMMLTVAPMAGLGTFAVNAEAGMLTIGWMLFTHIVFGVVLGGVYGRLVQREKRAGVAMAQTA